MSKTYLAKKDFWIGEINKELKTGDTIKYDGEKGILILNEQSYEVKNLKAAIKAQWLVPEDGEYDKLDGPVGETAEEAADRKRKKRFEEMKNNKSTKDSIVKDEREVGRIVGGCVEDSKNPEKFAQALDLENPPKKDKKFSKEVIEDDTKVIKSGNLFNDAETKVIKKATNQETKEKKAIKGFEVFKDHYDADAIHIGKYTNLNKEQTIKTWSQLHWTKKADIIKSADKDFLKELKTVESSEKMVKRINKQLRSL